MWASKRLHHTPPPPWQSAPFGCSGGTRWRGSGPALSGTGTWRWHKRSRKRRSPPAHRGAGHRASGGPLGGTGSRAAEWAAAEGLKAEGWGCRPADSLPHLSVLGGTVPRGTAGCWGVPGRRSRRRCTSGQRCPCPMGGCSCYWTSPCSLKPPLPHPPRQGCKDAKSLCVQNYLSIFKMRERNDLHPWGETVCEAISKSILRGIHISRHWPNQTLALAAVGPTLFRSAQWPALNKRWEHSVSTKPRLFCDHFLHRKPISSTLKATSWDRRTPFYPRMKTQTTSRRGEQGEGRNQFWVSTHTL